MSLAHFCEEHGPTQIICTQALPVECHTCNPSSASLPSQEADAQASKIVNRDERVDSGVRLDDSTPTLASSLTTPSATSRSSNGSCFALERQTLRCYSSGGESARRVCASCSFDVPKELGSSQSSDVTASSLSSDGESSGNSAVLRTRASYLARGSASIASSDGEARDPHSQSTSLSSSASSAGPKHVSFSFPPGHSPTEARLSRTRTNASASSSGSKASIQTHRHTVTYMTTPTLMSPKANTTLRQTITRAFSFEQLPRSDAASMLFGDPANGYTVAFVFHVQDAAARGRKRTYALLAMGSASICNVIGFIVKSFAKIAEHIQQKVSSKPERDNMARLSNSSIGMGNGVKIMSTVKERQEPVEDKQSSRKCTINLNRRSFINAQKASDPRSGSGGFNCPSFSKDVRAKGLPEIVGDDSFFVDIHVQFVRAMIKLNRHY